MIGLRIDPNILVYILDLSDIDRLRGGKGITAPDRSFMLRFTPDMKYTDGQLQDALSAGLIMDLSAFEQIMEESKKRKVVTR